MGIELTAIGELPLTLVANFEGVEVVVLPNFSGTDWIAVESVQKAIELITTTTTFWKGQINAMRQVEVLVNHVGAPRRMMFLRRRDFFGLAINHDRFKKFKDKVLDLVEAKQDGNLLELDPRVKDDPIVRQALMMARIAQQSALAEQEAKQAKQLAIQAEEKASRAEEKASRADEKATLALEGVHQRGERLTFRGWCKVKNVKVTWTVSQSGEEGKWLTSYSQKHLDDDPSKRKNKVQDEGFGLVNTYLKEAFDAWMEQRYPQLRSTPRTWF